MARGPSTFRQRDLTAAIRAAEAAGKEVVAVRVGKDGFEIITSRELVDASHGGTNEWDGESS